MSARRRLALNVLLFGATGMVGAGVLRECIDAPQVTSVLVVGRNPSGVVHSKITESVVRDLFDLGPIRASLAGRDACFFCLGVSAVGMKEPDYRRITYDLTLTIAREVLAASPTAVFVYVTGEGTDSSETGRQMWARVKGKTENDLLRLGFRAAYMFRPGFIQPLRGVRSRTRWYQAVYTAFGPVVPLLRRIAPQLFTTTVDVGRAMISVAIDGFPSAVLRTADINAAATRCSSSLLPPLPA